MLLNNIRNIIFDLGGVIINLDFPAAYGHFSRLSGLSLDQVKERTRGLMLFEDFEKGLIDSAAFRHQMRQTLNISSSDDEIDLAWNSLLGDIPRERLRLLQKLKGPYRTFALSNTNEIHVREFGNIAKKSLGSLQSFTDHFDAVYFSCEMKLRKPEPEIYQAVLTAEKLAPAQTLFIDDNAENIHSAAQLGIRTLHLTDAGTLTSLFNGDF